MQIEITDRAYLIVPADMAMKYFPTDNLVALPRDGEIWLLPVNNQASGGLLMKRRNLKGDRSVLLVELVDEGHGGFYEAQWDESRGAMRVVGITNRVAK